MDTMQNQATMVSAMVQAILDSLTDEQVNALLAKRGRSRERASYEALREDAEKLSTREQVYLCGHVFESLPSDCKSEFAREVTAELSDDELWEAIYYKASTVSNHMDDLDEASLLEDISDRRKAEWLREYGAPLLTASTVQAWLKERATASDRADVLAAIADLMRA